MASFVRRLEGSARSSQRGGGHSGARGVFRFLAKKWKWSKSRVDRFIAMLEKRDMLRDTSRDSACVYSINDYNEFQSQSGNEWDSKRGSKRDTSGTAAGQQRDKEEEGKKVIKKQREDSQGETPCVDAPQDVDAKAADFEVFFGAFPKKEQRKAAAAAYMVARDRDVSAAGLLAGAKAYSAHVASTGEPIKFVLLAKNWLKNEGWRDQYEGGKAAPAPVPVCVDPSWGDIAFKLAAVVDQKLFDAYFAKAEFVAGDPPCIRFPTRTMRDLAERRCMSGIRSVFGVAALEVRT